MPLRETILLFACAPLFGQQYIISTFAIQGASLNNPTSVAVDAAGDIYLADWSGFVRKISARDGAAAIVAGNGVLGYSGDGGPATTASLGKGIAIVIDAAGNLYLADSDNNRIRKVEAATGIITTVAGNGAAIDNGDGGQATKAGVSRPSGIALDSAGNLYFSSSWSRIRRVNASSGTIETIAGQAVTSFGGDGGPAVEALFWDPIPSAVNNAGDLFIADYENSRIRVMGASSGIVTTLAGSGACAPGPLGGFSCTGGFAGDGGPAAQAMLNHAAAAALDSAGNLYIADTINHRIRRVDAASHLIYTIAGNGIAGSSGDGSLALLAQISFPAGIAADRTGRVYFTDESNNCIRVLTPVGTPGLQSRRRARN